MDPEADVTNRKSWNFIAFIINGAIGSILPIVMFFLIAYGYAIPEYTPVVWIHSSILMFDGD